jgi:hypothetical protein
MPDAADVIVSKTVTVTSPMRLGGVASPLPFKRAQRNAWTEKQRTLADNVAKATSVDDLQSKVSVTLCFVFSPY